MKNSMLDFEKVQYPGCDDKKTEEHDQIWSQH